MGKITYDLSIGDEVTAEVMSEIKESVNDLYDQSGSYKSFVGLLKHGGSPGDTLLCKTLNKTIPGTFTFSRSNLGEFTIQSSENSFGSEWDKCAIFLTGDGYSTAIYNAINLIDSVVIQKNVLSSGVFVQSDGLNSLSVEIRVYD